MKKKVLAILAVVGLVMMLVLPLASPVMASSNEVNQDLSKDLSFAHNGDTVNYSVRVFNGATGDPGMNIDVKFQPPGLDGNSNAAAEFSLGTITYLPPGFEVIFDTINSGNDNLADPSPVDASRHYYVPNLAVVLNVTPGVTQATAKSIISGNLDAPPANDPFNDDKEITLYMLCPNTLVTIEASDTEINPGQSVAFGIHEANTGCGSFPYLTNPHVIFTDGTNTWNLTGSTAGNPAFDPASDPNTNGILDLGETWNWSYTSGPIYSDTTYSGTGHGIDVSGRDITPPTYEDEFDDVLITVLSPHTYTTIVAVPDSFPLGGGETELTVTEHNNGAIALSNVSVHVTGGTPDIDITLSWGDGPAFFGGDTDNVLEPGEYWQWVIQNVPVSDSSTYVASGYGDYIGSDPQNPVPVTGGDEISDCDVWVSPPVFVPGFSNVGLGILLAGFVVLMSIVVYRRTKRSSL